MVIFGFMVNFMLVPTWTIYPGASVYWILRLFFIQFWRKIAIFLKYSAYLQIFQESTSDSGIIIYHPKAVLRTSTHFTMLYRFREINAHTSINKHEEARFDGMTT